MRLPWVSRQSRRTPHKAGPRAGFFLLLWRGGLAAGIRGASSWFVLAVACRRRQWSSTVHCGAAVPAARAGGTAAPRSPRSVSSLLTVHQGGRRDVDGDDEPSVDSPCRVGSPRPAETARSPVGRAHPTGSVYTLGEPRAPGTAPAGAEACSHGWSGGRVAQRRPPRNPWIGGGRRTRPGGAEGAPADGCAPPPHRRTVPPPRRGGLTCFRRPTGSAAAVAARRSRRSTRGYRPRPLPGPGRSSLG